MLEPHLAEKNKKKQNLDSQKPQPLKGFSTPHYTEKTGGLPHCQTPPTPNLLERPRPRPTGEQINGRWYSHFHPWEKPA
jgi:hypothetical protein